MTAVPLIIAANADAAAAKAVVDAVRALGAVSPASAQPAPDFNADGRRRFEALVVQGTIREGAPGTFYVYERPAVDAAKRRRNQRILLVVSVLLGAMTAAVIALVIKR